ncbi:MAG: hypothetical protein MHM6MM_006362 [Cercozoa sp. M6MM]
MPFWRSNKSTESDASWAARETDNFRQVAFEGQKLLLTNRFVESENFLSPYITRDANCALVHAMAAFVRGAASLGVDELDVSLERIWAAEKIAAKENDNSIRAHCHLLGALVQLLLQRYIKATWNLRKAWSYYTALDAQIDAQVFESGDAESLLSEQHRHADLYASVDFGVGLFNLLLSLLPPSILRVAQIFGFQGDRDVALKRLAESAEREVAEQEPALFAPFSAVMLGHYGATIGPFFGDASTQDTTRQEALVQRFLTLFPESAAFLGILCRQERLKKNMDGAIDAARRMSVATAEIPAFAMFADYNSAWCHLLACDPMRAAAMWKTCAECDEVFNKSGFRGMYWLLYAHCDLLDATGWSATSSPSFSTLSENNVREWSDRLRMVLNVVDTDHKSGRSTRKLVPTEHTTLHRAQAHLALLDELSGSNHDCRNERIIVAALIDVIEIILLWNAVSNLTAQGVATLVRTLNTWLERQQPSEQSEQQPTLQQQVGLNRLLLLKGALISSHQETVLICDTVLHNATHVETKQCSQWEKEVHQSTLAQTYLLHAETLLELHCASGRPLSDEIADNVRASCKQASSFDFDMSRRIRFRAHAIQSRVRRLLERERNATGDSDEQSSLESE